MFALRTCGSNEACEITNGFERKRINHLKGPSEAWRTVVEAEGRFTQAVLAVPQDELEDTLTWALEDFSSRQAVLRILISAHPHLTSAALPALEPLLLMSHPLLDECRTLAIRLPPPERFAFSTTLDHQGDQRCHQRRRGVQQTS